MEKPTSPLIKTLHLSNYRSLAGQVSIPLGPLSVLVGKNMQIVVSTHSPHLLSRCHPDQILVVERKSATTVRPLEGRQRELVLAGTLTLGDLMLAEDLRQEPIVPQA